METGVPDVELASSASLDVPPTSSPVGCDPAKSRRDTLVSAIDDFSLPYNALPEHAFAHTYSHPQLTAHVPGETATHHNNGAPANPSQQFDPRALLNPRIANSKRPASSGGESDRGRPDATIAGQVSLVERLHNVQERTASPVKRVKTEDPQRQSPSRPNFAGGSGLDLQNQNGFAAPPRQAGSAIDLTMSKSSASRTKR